MNGSGGNYDTVGSKDKTLKLRRLTKPQADKLNPVPDMKSKFPTADEYSSQTALYPPMTVVDIRSAQAGITDSYRNEVLFNINRECMRMSVFEGEYRWHHHPDSDELFLVVAGELQIDFESGDRVTLNEWQSVVVPAGKVHRTRATGRTVNVTFEKQGARTVFVDPPLEQSFKGRPHRGSA